MKETFPANDQKHMDNDKALENAWDYAKSFYDNPQVLDDFEALARHLPSSFISYMDMRQGLFDSSALTNKERELILVGMEIISRKTNPPPIGHTLKALSEGATIDEIAEVVGLCILIGGMITFRESGRFVLRAAEEHLAGNSDA